METNDSGATTKKIWSDGRVQKEYNEGHQWKKTAENEKSEHVHDYKPNFYHPEGRPNCQKGIPLKRNEILKDRYKTQQK